MRKYGILLGVLLAAVLLAGMAQGISQGPGGRLYLAGQSTTGAGVTHLYSMVLDQNWDIVGGGGGGGAGQIYHGSIADGSIGPWRNEKERAGCSPEPETYGGAGYGTIVMGAYYNNSPASTLGYQTLDVLRIQCKDTGYDCQLIGDGRAYGGVSGDCHTDGAFWALPDPKGQYTGGVGYYSIQGYGGNPWDYFHQLIVTDTNGGGDVTDDTSDYVAALHSPGASMDTPMDSEIYGKRLYYRQYGVDGTVHYWERKPDGTIADQKKFGPNLHYQTYECGMAAGEVRDNGLLGGKLHQAAWTIDYIDHVGGTNPHIVLLVDWNDDNDALDTAGGTGYKDEYLPIYGINDAHLSGYDDPNYYTGDLEWVKNEQGTMFLIVSRNDGWNSGAIYVLQLDDNGDYTLGDNGIHMIMATSEGYVFPNDWGESEIEFDSKLNLPVPEPATVLLIGTGVLGVLGYIRRRRMS